MRDNATVWICPLRGLGMRAVSCYIDMLPIPFLQPNQRRPLPPFLVLLCLVPPPLWICLQRAAAVSGPVAAGIAEALAGAMANNAASQAAVPASQHRGGGAGVASGGGVSEGALPPPASSDTRGGFPPPPLPWFFDGLSPSPGFPHGFGGSRDAAGSDDNDGTSVSSSIDRLLYGTLAGASAGRRLRDHRQGGGPLRDMLLGGGGEGSLSSVSSLSEGGLVELLGITGVDWCGWVAAPSTSCRSNMCGSELAVEGDAVRSPQMLWCVDTTSLFIPGSCMLLLTAFIPSTFSPLPSLTQASFHIPWATSPLLSLPASGSPPINSSSSWGPSTRPAAGELRPMAPAAA